MPSVFPSSFNGYHYRPDLLNLVSNVALSVLVWLIRLISSPQFMGYSAINIFFYSKQHLCECWYRLCLTLLVGCEKDAEATFTAGFICPHADDTQRGNQHDVVGDRGTELALQVFHWTVMRQDEIKTHGWLLSSMVISCALIIHIIEQTPLTATMTSRFSDPYRIIILWLSLSNKWDCSAAHISFKAPCNRFNYTHI